MTENINPNLAAGEPGSPTAALDLMERTMGQFMASAQVDAVYGKPIKHGDTLIIPTAEVLNGMGFGVGFGSGPEGDDAAQAGGGGGGGGGGRVFSRPVAVIVSSPEGVRVEPVIDLTKIAMAALTAGGFVFGMMFRMLNARRPFPEIEE